MPQDFKVKKNFDIFLLLVPLENILHYPDTDISQWLRKIVQWTMFKVLNGFDTFFSHFSIEFLVFACICCCFHSHKTYCNILLTNYARQISFVSNRGTTEQIFGLLFKAIDFNGC